MRTTATFSGSTKVASWGVLKPITRPVIGGREYGKTCHRNDAGPYFGYWAPRLTGPGGYYSIDVGMWHIVVLNSECDYGTGPYAVGGCQAGIPHEASASCGIPAWC